jgi:hypothetical protein
MRKAIDSAMRFYSCNYINRNCQFEYAGSETLDFLKLSDFEPYNNSFSFSSAGASLSFSCSFKDKFGKFIVRSIDALVLQNCNIKSMQVKYIDTSSNEVLAYQLTNNLNSEIRIAFPQKVRTSKIIFNIQETFDNKGVRIGQLRVLEKLFELKATTETEINYCSKEGKLRTYNGRLITWTDYSKWSATVSAKNVSKKQYDLLKFFVCRDGFISIEPFGEFEIKDIYEVYIKREDLNYGVNRWSGLFDINFRFEGQEDAAN